MRFSALTDKRLNIKHGNNTVIRTLLKLGINRQELVTYKEFINSKEWVLIKDAWYKKYKKICLKCNSQKNIHLHHIVYPLLEYDGRGTYRQVQDRHFISLCDACHKLYHDTYGVHMDMITTSIDFIGKERHNRVFNKPKRYIKKKKNKSNKQRKLKKKKTKKRTTMSASQLLHL